MFFLDIYAVCFVSVNKKISHKNLNVLEFLNISETLVSIIWTSLKANQIDTFNAVGNNKRQFRASTISLLN